ncbi:putative DNA polymerase [Leptolyngbya phage Lbo-JY46]
MIKLLGINSLFDEVVDVDYLLDYFKNHTHIQFDLETSGFDPYTSKVLCFQIGDKDTQFVCDPLYINKCKALLESKILIGHNIKFDLKFLNLFGIFPTKVHDTFVVEYVLTQGIDKRRNLAAVLYERLGINLDKSIRENIFERGLTQEVIQYSANDVKYLHEIMEQQLKEGEEKDLLKKIRLENSFVPVLAYIENCGLKLDIEKWKLKIIKDKENLIKAKKVLDDWIIENNIKEWISVQLNLFSSEKEVLINWNSPKQVASLFKSLGVPIEYKDGDKLKESVGNVNIAKYEKDFPIIKNYLEYKKVEKLVGTYGENFFSHINPVTGRVHTNFKQLMDTGRLSSGGKNRKTKEEYINFQNIPSDKFTRSCFIAEEGNTLLISDYSGQEQVVLANNSLDENLLQFYDSGFSDMHSFVASKMFKYLSDVDLDTIKNQYKEERQKAKSAGFAIN